VTASSDNKYQLQWAEWESAANTGALLKASATPTFFGAPAAGEWPNPIEGWTIKGVNVGATTLAFVNASVKPSVTVYDPTVYGYAATPGNIMWYPENTGAGKATATSKMDFWELDAQYKTAKAAVTSYEALVTSYNTAKTAYNKALADEKARKADFFKAMFEPAVVIPERPCQPVAPATWSGLDFKYASTAALTAAEKTAKTATFAEGGTGI
jgi:hypothetical protein